MYLKFFGLREAPFNLTPDPKFFFSSERHREALAGLYYGIKNKKGFIVVTGEVGTGKTTVIRKLLRNLEATHRSVFIFNTLLTFDELFEAILRDLDIEPAPGRVAMHQQLNEYLLDQVKKGHIVSLLIDEAQNLGEDSLEAVRLLSNLETDREKLLQIILVGQPELDLKLNSRSLRQLKQRVSLWCRLDRLTRGEMDAYVAHRLAVAGYQGAEIFPKASLGEIWEQSGGTPRLINTICDNALLTAFAMSLKTVSPDVIREVVQDLQLIAGQLTHTEPSELPQPPKQNPGRMTNFSENAVHGKSKHQEDPEPLRLQRAPVEVVSNLVRKRERPDADWRSSESDELFLSRRQKSVARAAEIKETASWIGESQKKSPGLSPVRPVKVDPKSGPAEEMALPPGFFDEMIAALTYAMGPMAPVVLREQVANLGQSLERFPNSRLGDLLLALKSEILSEDLRETFEAQMHKHLQVYSHSTYQTARPATKPHSG